MSNRMLRILLVIVVAIHGFALLLYGIQRF